MRTSHRAARLSARPLHGPWHLPPASGSVSQPEVPSVARLRGLARPLVPVLRDRSWPASANTTAELRRLRRTAAASAERATDWPRQAGHFYAADLGDQFPPASAAHSSIGRDSTHPPAGAHGTQALTLGASRPPRVDLAVHPAHAGWYRRGMGCVGIDYNLELTVRRVTGWTEQPSPQ
jgi:hypothetical protein